MGRNPARAPLDLLLGLVAMLAGVATGSAVSAQPASLADLVSAVVRVKTEIEADRRTVDTLIRVSARAPVS